jgi:polyisoprenoid-binding protein YceI
MSTAVSTGTSTWNIDPAHSAAQFRVRHMMISHVNGEFRNITGKLELNGSDITKSQVETSIDAATINTREADRDQHLKSADFLDVEKFPTLSFKSTHISRKGDDELAVEGDLTIHGVTRKVVFEVEGPSPEAKDPWGNTRIGLTATTRIQRGDYGLNWNAVLEAGGILVGEEVKITLDAEFIKG